VAALGPKKLRVKLSEHHPALAVRRRARSAIGCDAKEWLSGRLGAVRCPPYARPFAAVTGANDVMVHRLKGGFAPAAAGAAIR